MSDYRNPPAETTEATSTNNPCARASPPASGTSEPVRSAREASPGRRARRARRAGRPGRQQPGAHDAVR